MKRRDLERHLRGHGCVVAREGGRHTIWVNPATDALAPVARHRELPATTVRAVCVQLGVPEPRGR